MPNQPHLNIHPLPALRDNYIWVLEQSGERGVYIVDPGEAQPVLDYLQRTGNTIVAILVTHQHWDHVSGIPELAALASCPVYGPKIEQHPSVTHPLSEGDTVPLWSALQAQVWETPGHLPDHLCYLISEALGDSEQLHVLCADTLFSAGCGRIFRGEPAQLKQSLDRIAALPEETKLYSAHEYTLRNLGFALAVEPDNNELEAEYERVSTLREHKLPSLPTTVGHERRINPFLRTGDPAIQAAVSQHVDRNLHKELKKDLAVFTELRQWKDVY